MIATKVKNIDEAINWYIDKRPVYLNLAKKVESIIREVLNANGASYYVISSRAKEIESFSEKAKKEKYRDPINELKDLAGIRVITYVKSEVDTCCQIIKPLFNIDQQHSVDKAKELGDDKVGYRSIHYVAELTDDRLKLPEYRIFKGMCFEVQIRTILEHAWADISHDRNYKFKGVLPPDNDIERRFSLAAATLELVDREFNAIAKEIDTYKDSVINNTSKGNLGEIDINSTSLEEYLKIKFAKFIEDTSIEASFKGGEKDIIKELNLYGLKSLSDIDEIIGSDLVKFTVCSATFLGLLRDAMVLHDANKYFSNAWITKWVLDDQTYNFYKNNRVNIDEMIEKYNIKFEEDDLDEDDLDDHDLYVDDLDEDL
ncbi:GTP pyrophosphokinase family protein [Brevibacillus sp. BC25]|uniref:GTP pyrophosphokinase n=1 Tax=Brevibacillus sp. BC25 TaxID=1144308 RepID=UPI000270E5A3|nr:RelA/SpoT domain-containing protein [Brevibacillus sp. BC25]EJL28212.1 hypothetical protein PMI05_02472 [Brevibacillus sp. BC25]